jgi:hypothetical protein
MTIINILGGALLLAFGRKFFWFFVAATGFYAGYELAFRYLINKPAWMVLSIALVFGVLGTLLVYFFEKIAIGAAGFFAGAYIASRLISYLAAPMKNWNWLIILIGGIIGVILMYIIFEWALIILSSLAGTILIVEGFKLTGLIAMIIGIFLFAAGIFFQFGLNRRDGPRKKVPA